MPSGGRFAGAKRSVINVWDLFFEDSHLEFASFLFPDALFGRNCHFNREGVMS